MQATRSNVYKNRAYVLHKKTLVFKIPFNAANDCAINMGTFAFLSENHRLTKLEKDL